MSEYDDDILLWSEHQADLLRRVAAGERVNNQVDWENVAEEIEDLGRSELRSVESLLAQALRHMMKAEGWPQSRDDAANWRADAIDFRRQARRRFVPSMRQKIDMAALYADALAALPEVQDGLPPLPIMLVVPTLEEMLGEPAATPEGPGYRE